MICNTSMRNNLQSRGAVITAENLSIGSAFLVLFNIKHKLNLAKYIYYNLFAYKFKYLTDITKSNRYQASMHSKTYLKHS